MTHVGSLPGQDAQVIEHAPVACGGRVKVARWGARLCLACGERRARFLYRGVVKADRDHNLCFECFRAECNRLRARRLGAGGAWVPPANAHPARSKMVADRAGLLRELAVRRRHAQIMARHALDAAGTVQVAEPLAS